MSAQHPHVGFVADSQHFTTRLADGILSAMFKRSLGLFSVLFETPVIFLLATLGAGCIVDDSFLDGQPCGPEKTCAGGYVCVREPCQEGRLCPVCRKSSALPDGDGGDVDEIPGGDRPDGGDPAGDEPIACDSEPPSCKTLPPDCQPVEPRCAQGVWVCDNGYEAEEKTCDGLDNDCDGSTDEGLVCILAGEETAGFENGSGAAARFNKPRGLATHPSGGVVVADRGNHAIRLVAFDGSTTTLAGTGRPGANNGPAADASFREPTSVAVAADGSILVADSLNDRIRRVTPAGEVTTEAGSGFPDFLDGPVLEARFAAPTGVAVSPAGVIFVADADNHCIRRIENGQVSTFAGTCRAPGFVDGSAKDARFNHPTDLWLLANGQLLVSEESSHAVRQVAPDGQVTTLAGTGQAGLKEGEPLQAQFWKPAGCLEDATNASTLVADTGNNRIRAIAVAVDTRLGSGALGLDNGPPLQASFRQPSGLAFFGDGRLVIADTNNNVLRVVNR